MKIKYDKSLDILYIRFSDERIVDSDSDKPGVIMDYDAQGRLVAIEVLNASKKMPNPTKLEYETT